MFKYFKQKRCQHEFEIVTKGEVHHNLSATEYYYYHITKATCVKCKYKEVLDAEKVSYTNNEKLIKVHRDPLKKYEWFQNKS